ncbi:MAG: tRNA (N6-threonylcarbamoyladenosine(37)-N6)-methyltransferase TrmO [Candidatus Dormibacteraceae bacterium]
MTEPRTQRYELISIGWVESPLLDRAQAPRQGNEGAPDAWLAFESGAREGIRDLALNAEVIVLTWLDRADRSVLSTVPGDDPGGSERGVFSTRSPDRPNPIGIHRVRILEVDGLRIRVSDLEALNGTPIVDVKPVLDATAER